MFLTNLTPPHTKLQKASEATETGFRPNLDISISISIIISINLMKYECLPSAVSSSASQPLCEKIGLAK